MRNVVILGMHRSGTSMVAGSLAAAGVNAGATEDLLTNQEDNPAGFWERRDTVELNDTLLAAHSAAWYQPPDVGLTFGAEHQKDIDSILSKLNGTGNRSWLIKDPRLALTWSAWEASLHSEVLLFVYRNPFSVALSLNKRNGFPFSLGLALWEIYNRAILKSLVGRETVCVSFDTITEKSAETLSDIYSQLLAHGVMCDAQAAANTFDSSLVGATAKATVSAVLGTSDNKELVAESRRSMAILMSDGQRQLATYCESLCADEPLPELPVIKDSAWVQLHDIASSMASLATVVETENELDHVTRLCKERTEERDHTIAQLGRVESEHTALSEAHGREVSRHQELESDHRGLMAQHGTLSEKYSLLVGEHKVLVSKAEYLFSELTGTYAKLLDFRQSTLGRLWHTIGRGYKFATGRRGSHTRYDDALADAHVHFEQHKLMMGSSDKELQNSPQEDTPAGKLSMLRDVLKYVARNPAGTVRSFSLTRMKRATSVFITSSPEDLDVWVNARFPDKEAIDSNNLHIDPQNLDPTFDDLKLEFPSVTGCEANKIKVSIIIPVYNDYRMTLYCLQQLLENTSDVIYEVVIGDDCSTDLTTSIADRVSNITVVRGDKNRGFLENCNAAAVVAQGEHVLFLNNDTGVCANWLAPLVEILERNPAAGIVGPQLLFADGKLQEAGGIVWDDASAWNFGRMDDPAKPEYSYVREVDYISGACLLVRGALWRQLGGFDKRYVPAYYEDTDIAFEARATGYTVVYQPLSQVFHFEGVSNGTDLESGIKQYQVQNQQKFREKWNKELAAFHFPNAEQVFRARDRSRNKRSVLFIDHYVPHYDKDAGSRSTFMYVQLMLEMGYKVLFLGANYFPHKPYTQKLQQLGVEVLVGESMARNQDRWLAENAPYIDRIYLHRPHIAEQILGSLEKMKPRPPIIFFGHDLHYLRIGREEKVVGDASLAKSAQKWKKREYAVFDRVDKIYYPSQVEVDEISTERPDLSVRAIPLYVLEGEVEEAYDFDASSDILFVGGFNHPPNVDGICWFVEKILPLVKEKCPNMKLHVVGSNPNDAVQDLQSEDVFVYGYLSDDELGELYRRVRQVIVPLRFGAGVKGKVLEAIQKNVPLVTTSIGAEGIPDVESVMNIANSAEDFANTIIRLDSGDAELLAKMAQYDVWLKKNFSKENAMSIILEDFGPPQVSS